MSKSILGCVTENEPHSPGSVLITGECGHRVWVSQSGLQAIKDWDLEVSCIACMHPDIPVIRHPGIQKELEEQIGKEAAEQIMSEVEDSEKLKLLMMFSKRMTFSKLFRGRERRMEVNPYDIARKVTDEILGEGAYDTLNEFNSDPEVQAAIERGKKEEDGK